MNLFRRPECVIHEVNVTIDPDRCVKCGAVNRWTIPAAIDYEAATKTLINAGPSSASDEMVAAAVVDAAVGEEEQ